MPQELFTSHVKQAVNSAMRQHDGPKAWLQNNFSNPKDAVAFGTWLQQKLPLRQSIFYGLNDAGVRQIEKSEIGNETPTHLHVSLMSFHAECSIMPPCDAVQGELILDDIMARGWQSGSEPLLAFKMEKVWIPTEFSGVTARVSADAVVHMDPDSVLPIFSIGQLKGQSRVHVLQCLLGVIFLDAPSLDMGSMLPGLVRTADLMHAYILEQPSAKEASFINLEMTYRSSIRKVPNVVHWYRLLKRLQGKGYAHYGSIVGEWNTQASDASKLKGQKAVAVKVMMEDMPAMVVEEVEKHTAEFSWDGCCLNDFRLTSKKILTGSKLKCPAGHMVTVTNESMWVMMVSTFNEWRKRHPNGRRTNHSKKIWRNVLHGRQH